MHALATLTNAVISMQGILPAGHSDASLSDIEFELYFIYAVIWSCGGFLTATNKAKFSTWWRAKFNLKSPKLCFPSRGAVWDYYVKPGCPYFVSWSSKVPPLSLPVDKTEPPFVPTTRSVAISHLISVLISGSCPVLLNGEGASGKSSLLKQILAEVCKGGAETALLHVYWNRLTSSEVIWNQLQDCLEWDWGKKYTPKNCKKLICYLDDLHNTEVYCN